MTRRFRSRLAIAAAIASVTILCATSCAQTGGEPIASDTATGPTLPPTTSAFDYQLGGAYPPPAGVEIVARDRTSPPADGLYNICYINAFQTQPGEISQWPDDLLVHDADGTVVFDPDWPDEAIIDTRRAAEVAALVRQWISGCADSGFDAVEFDNLDTYTRTDGALSRDDNLILARTLVEAAHAAGLAAGQKNAAEDAALLRDEAGFDFAIVEECTAFRECDAYTAVYGDHVLAIEYPDTLDIPFADACAATDAPASLILRDRDLVTPERPDYLFESCP